jgi:hypothetical protein
MKVSFSLNNPCAANAELFPEYVLATSLYIAHCSKYTASIKAHLFKLILNNMSSELNFFKYKLNEVLYGEPYMIECLKLDVPMS